METKTFELLNTKIQQSTLQEFLKPEVSYEKGEKKKEVQIDTCSDLLLLSIGYKARWTSLTVKVRQKSTPSKYKFFSSLS